MIVISAASGALGRLVVGHLRPRADVVAAVRDPARAPGGVPVRRADYDDPASLRAAFEGADRDPHRSPAVHATMLSRILAGGAV